MPPTYANRRYLDALADHVVVFAGAMGTSIQKYNLSAADFGGEQLWGCNDYLVITRPEVIREIHASYLAVGCEVIETNTFRANRLALREYGLSNRVREINQAGAALARQVADQFTRETGIPRLVAGNLGPTGLLPSSADPALSNITFQELADVFAEQAGALAAGGVDLLLLETQQDILEVKAAVYGINRFFQSTGQRLPLQVQVTLDTTGRMLLGTDIAAVLAILDALPVEVIGLNCSTGPDYMKEPIRYLTSHTRKPVSAVPNAGLPLNIDGEACYPLEPQAPGRQSGRIRHRAGGPGRGRLLRHHPGAYAGRGRSGPWSQTCRVSRWMTPLAWPRPCAPWTCTRCRRRTSSANASTPRAARPPSNCCWTTIMTASCNWPGTRPEAGAHSLDICVALTERADEARQMQTVVKLLSQTVELPLVLDSTEVDVIRAALEVCPGRPIVNSINLENGRDRADAVLELCRDFGAAVIALTIDEAGMARTALAETGNRPAPL